jgi:hypothetical protein
MPTVLPADWRNLPLHQTLRGWERPSLYDETRHRSYWAPSGLRAEQRQLLARVETAGRPIDGGVEYRARMVRIGGPHAVSVDGVADDRGSYLVAWVPAPLVSRTVVVAEGTLERGGFTVGLVDDTGWVERVDVQTPGPFRVFVQAPRTGRYQIVVANNVKAIPLRNRFTFSRLIRVDGDHD